MTCKFIYNVPVDNTRNGDPACYINVEATEMASGGYLLRVNETAMYCLANVKDWVKVFDDCEKLAKIHMPSDHCELENGYQDNVDAERWMSDQAEQELLNHY